MDKYEFKHLLDQILNLIDQGRYAEAVRIADTIDWSRVKNVITLGQISDLYKINCRYEDARDIMLMAYERKPESRQVCYSLCELYCKTGEPTEAASFYREFEKLAPRDPGRYILKYKVYDAFGTNIDEKIEVLEKLKEEDYQEKWMYELAKLYHRRGLGTKCVETCDELILWFGEGKYVNMAMELKMLHEPLTPSQQQKYDNRFRSAEYGDDQQFYEGQGYQEQVGYEVQPQEQVLDDARVYAQENLRQEYAQNGDAEEGHGDRGEGYADTGYSLNGTGTGYDGEESVSKGHFEEGYGNGDTAITNGSEDAVGNRESAGHTRMFNVEEVRRQMKEQATTQDDDMEIQVKTVDVSQYNTMNLQAELAEGLREVLGHGNEQADVAGEMVSDASRELDASMEEEPATLKQDKETVQATADEFREVDDINRQVMEEMRRDSMKTLVKQAMTAQPPEPMAQVLTQESDGQIRLVVPEIKRLEKQITGQMSIEDIRAEWERMKQESKAKQEEEVRQEVIRNTGKMFTEFEEKVRDALLRKKEEEKYELSNLNAVYEQASFGQEGYDQDHYSQEGYDQDHYSQEGYDQKDYKQEAYHQEDYEQEAPKQEEFSQGASGDDWDLEGIADNEVTEYDGERGEFAGVIMEAPLESAEEPKEAAPEESSEEEPSEEVPSEEAEEAAREAEEVAEESLEEEPSEEVPSEEAEEAAQEAEEEAEETVREAERAMAEPSEEVSSEEAEEAAQETEEEAEEPSEEESSEVVAESEETLAEKPVETVTEVAEEIEVASAEEAAKEEIAPAEEANEPLAIDAGEATGDSDIIFQELPQRPITLEEELDSGDDFAWGDEPFEQDGDEQKHAEDAESPEDGSIEDGDIEDGNIEFESLPEEDFVTDGMDDEEEAGESAGLDEKRDPGEKSGDGEEEDNSEDIISEEDELEESGARSLTKEEEEIYGSMVQGREAREQLVRAIDAISMAPYTGNLVITGDAGMNTLELAKKMIYEIKTSDSNFSGKVAKVPGAFMNAKDVTQLLNGSKNGALIIEKASSLSDRSAQDLYKNLQRENFGIIVVLLDTKKGMKEFFKKYEKLKPLFNAHMHMKPLSNEALAYYARQYARDNEFAIDDMGLLALHTRIDELQTANHAANYEDVRAIMDDAIYSASRKSLGHFFDILFGRRYDEEDMIYITEKDFR